MITPRPYISYSQMALFEMSPEKYANQYIYGLKQRVSRNMAYGSALAQGLEDEEANGDPLLDLMAARLPKFELMDKPLEAELPDGSHTIRLLAKMDTSKSDYTAFKEYKTSTRKWTQKMADKSDQITFYATTIWLATGRIPKDIELINIQVAYTPDGQLSPTGDMWRFKTTRSMVDLIKMCQRIRRVWHLIQGLCDVELI